MLCTVEKEKKKDFGKFEGKWLRTCSLAGHHRSLGKKIKDSCRLDSSIFPSCVSSSGGSEIIVIVDSGVPFTFHYGNESESSSKIGLHMGDNKRMLDQSAMDRCLSHRLMHQLRENLMFYAVPKVWALVSSISRRKVTC